MRIIGVSLLSDNYAWVLSRGDGGYCAIVDPSDDEPLLDLLREEGLQPRWILATHHHHDHVGGIRGITRAFPGVEVLCSAIDGAGIGSPLLPVGDGERVSVVETQAEALLVPGHTLGAVAWHFPAEEALFTGDTLFCGGCGRLFEGTPAQMYESLMRLRALPPNTRVHCGHEYTVKNLEFALEIEPSNTEVLERLKRERLRIARGEPTVPSTLALELRTNPFLRADEPGLMSLLERPDPLSTFTELRRRRNSF